jgi:hypothetical protein
MAEHLEFVVSLAREAGKKIRMYFSFHTCVASVVEVLPWGENFGSHSLHVNFKAAIDLVTAIDREVEEYLFSQLKSKYPDFKYLGEETAADQGTSLSHSLSRSPSLSPSLYVISLLIS